MSPPDRAAFLYYRWTIRFKGGRYTVDAPTAADAVTMYGVNVARNPRFSRFRFFVRSQQSPTDRFVPQELTVGLPYVTPLEKGLWIDDERFDGVGDGSP